VRENLKVKEVVLREGAERRRYVVAQSPEQAHRDRARREKILAWLELELKALGDVHGKRHTKAACALRAHPAVGRYLEELNGGGCELIGPRCGLRSGWTGSICSPKAMRASPGGDRLELQAASKVERAFRSLKHTLELRLIYHCKEEQVRAHVTLCWLALLLVRILERESGQSWERVREVVERIHLLEVET